MMLERTALRQPIEIIIKDFLKAQDSRTRQVYWPG